MQIHVTQDHIDRGLPHCPEKCPVALALKDATNRHWIVNNHNASSPNEEEQKHRLVRLNDFAREFVTRFDTDVNQQPFSFEFDYECKESSSNE